MTDVLDMEKLLEGDVATLARGLSLVERGGAIPLVSSDAEGSGSTRARRIVVSGPPGVGKSTLLRSILAVLRGRGERVGVIACDPSSARTGGAFLGDRVRWSEFAEDEGVFVRSVAKSADVSKVERTIEGMADLFDAAGWPWIFLETVGAGQSEEPGMSAAPTLLVLSPACGDEIQMLKAGVVESAHLYAVNRLDLPGGERWATSLEETLALGEGDPPVVLRVDAQSGEGVEELLEELKRTTPGA